MKDKLLIVTKIKKTIDYLECITNNFPKVEYELKNSIIKTIYQLLELAYKANVFKETKYMKELIVKIRMLDYFIKVSLDKKIINYKKYEIMGKHLLELKKMTISWINYENSRQSI